MANYQSKYTGEQIDEAVGKALAGGDKALIVFVTNADRSLKVYFDNEGTGTSQGTLSSTGIRYFTGFTDYVYFKGSYTDDIYKTNSGKAVNCDAEFINGEYCFEAMKVSNFNGIGIVTLHDSSEPIGGDIDPEPV